MTYINGSSTTYCKGPQSINIGRYDGVVKGRFNVLFFFPPLTIVKIETRQIEDRKLCLQSLSNY